MKTIKLSLIGLLSLFITVLLIKYAVLSYNNITTDFQPLGTTEVYNFGITFLFQCILLLSLAIISFTFAIVSFTQANKHYKLWCTKRKIMQLVNHIDEEEYNEVIKKIERASNTLVKKVHVYDYLKNKNKPLKNTADIVKENNNNMARDIALATEPVLPKKAFKIPADIIPERDTYNPIEFERKDSE